MKNVVVTGGSGFVGSHLILELFHQYPDINVTSLSVSEQDNSRLLVECPRKGLKTEIMDIRNERSVKYVLENQDTVLHLAAMKHVDVSEVECREAATINIIGTINVLDAFCGETFILMSTNKMVEPVNCYGGTKLIAERMVLERATKAKSGQRFMIIRSGNIIGSTGSVLDIWKKQIAQNNEITVTHPDMERYYTNVTDVVKLYMAVLARGKNGKIYIIPNGKPQILRDLVHQVITQYGNEKTKVRYIGLRPGERIVEKMYNPDEKNIIANI
jgi:UDP-N-acetylglucosamine 4,6-dehydratase/5-epimerase